MGWTTILSFGLSLAIAAAISFAIARSKEGDRSFSVPIFVVAVVILYSILAPAVSKWQAERQLEHYPFYKQIAKTDPATYKRIREVVLDAVQNHRPDAETARQIAAILGPALPGQISRASDDSVVAFAREMSQLLSQMSRTNPDACFYLLHPEKRATTTIPNDSTYEKAEEQLLNAMAEILESAANHPQAVPDPEQSQALVQGMFASLRKKHGKDTALLSGAAGTSEERKKVCEMSAEVFREVTAMPKAEGSMALRSLLSKAAVEHSAQ